MTKLCATQSKTRSHCGWRTVVAGASAGWLGCISAPREPAAALATSAAGLTFNVRQAPFGAHGDGLADDTPALQAAIRRAASAARTRGGAVLRIPAGTYRLTGRLELTDDDGAPARDLEIQGDGLATVLAFEHGLGDHQGIAVYCDGGQGLTLRDFRISAARGGVGFNRGVSLHGGAHITVRDLDISGASLTRVDGRSFGYPAGIFVDGGATDVRIVDNTLHDNGGNDGNSSHILIYTSGGASNVAIVGNRCFNPVGALHQANVGIGVFDSTFVTIERNYVEGIVGTTRDADGYGIMLYGSGVGRSHHHVILGNTVRRTDGTGVYVQGSPYSTVIGNLVEDTALTQSSTTLAAAGITFNQGPGTISANVVRGVGRGSTQPNPPSGVAIQTCLPPRSCAPAGGIARGVSVSNNTIESTAGYGIAVEAGPSASANNSIIVNNTLVDTVGGIVSSGDAELAGLLVTGNSITRGLSARSAGLPGIALANLSGSVIANNTVDIPDGQSILLGGAARNNIICNNVLRVYGSVIGGYPGIQVTGVGNSILGNQLTGAGLGAGRRGIVEAGSANRILFNSLTSDDAADPPGIHASGSNTFRSQNGVAGDALDAARGVPH